MCRTMLHANIVPETTRCNLQTRCPKLSHLLLPSLVHNACPICLPLLQQRLALPLRHVERINVPTRLNAEAAARRPRRGAAHGRHVDVLARVELVGRLGAVDLQVDAGGRVAGGDEPREGPAAGVEGHGGRGGVVDDEAVVHVRLGGAQREGLLALDPRVGRRLGRGRDAAVVDGEVGV